MPELPEVESVALHLRRLLPGRLIEQAVVTRPRLLPENTPEDFVARLQGASFREVGRRGKHVLIHLTTDDTLIVHLRMSGRFLYLDRNAALPRFTHAVFILDNDKTLAFNDQRHFGMMHLVRTENLPRTAELAKLAPEPLGDEFTVDYLAAALSRSRRNLKEFLLDQTRVLGLGNIYAAEALFAAGLDPKAPADTLARKHVKRLHTEIRAILRAAIDAGSTVQTDPEIIDGRYFGNSFEESLAVYDREGRPCFKCETPIERIRQGQRSTYFCPTCQSAPKGSRNRHVR